MSCGPGLARRLVYRYTALDTTWRDQDEEEAVPNDQVVGAGSRRRVRAVTVNLEPAAELGQVVEQTSRALRVSGVDLVVLPESCRGGRPEDAEPASGPTVTALGELARRHGVYVLLGLYRAADDGGNVVSAILLDRRGEIAGVYDKRYPFWSELYSDPALRPGSRPGVWETDFGVLGAAICFDINFAHVWADLADAGVDLVVWPSAYAGGTLLRSYAQIHHFHVLSCTQTGDSRVYDPVGKAVSWAPGPVDRSRVFDIDLGVGVYHHDFNEERLQTLMRERAGVVDVDAHLEAEKWYVLRAGRDGGDPRALAQAYGMEELRTYVHRSREQIDAIRAGAASASNPQGADAIDA